MAVEFEIVEDHTGEILAGLDAVKEIVLEKIGIKATKYAKALCPVGTPESTGVKGYRGGTLRNSIDYAVHDDEVEIGTNVEYAPYVELGTGPYFTPPPDWEQFGSSRGSGMGHGYVTSRPYLRPAIEEHLAEYGVMIATELGK